jgi:hypothetical protein
MAGIIREKEGQNKKEESSITHYPLPITDYRLPITNKNKNKNMLLGSANNEKSLDFGENLNSFGC